MAKVHGAGIIFYAKNPKRVILFVRDQKHPNPAKILPYPGMLDIIGGHMEALETPEQCIVREVAEEWFDLRTGKPFELRDFQLFEQLENDESVQWVFCKEADFDLLNIVQLEGAALAVMTEESAAKNQIAWGCTDLLRRFFKSKFFNGYHSL
ncbi:MAG: NUDIX domain-containing protein [Patescibacteria group bacterium]